MVLSYRSMNQPISICCDKCRRAVCFAYSLKPPPPRSHRPGIFYTKPVWVLFHSDLFIFSFFFSFFCLLVDFRFFFLRFFFYVFCCFIAHRLTSTRFRGTLSFSSEAETSSARRSLPASCWTTWPTELSISCQRLAAFFVLF